jgi:hypothetical protein
MEINLNMPCVLDRIGGEVGDTNVVAVDKRAPAQRTVKLLK